MFRFFSFDRKYPQFFRPVNIIDKQGLYSGERVLIDDVLLFDGIKCDISFIIVKSRYIKKAQKLS